MAKGHTWMNCITRSGQEPQHVRFGECEGSYARLQAQGCIAEAM
jgi:hypothetical protein